MESNDLEPDGERKEQMYDNNSVNSEAGVEPRGFTEEKSSIFIDNDEKVEKVAQDCEDPQDQPLNLTFFKNSDEINISNTNVELHADIISRLWSVLNSESTIDCTEMLFTPNHTVLVAPNKEKKHQKLMQLAETAHTFQSEDPKNSSSEISINNNGTAVSAYENPVEVVKSDEEKNVRKEELDNESSGANSRLLDLGEMINRFVILKMEESESTPAEKHKKLLVTEDEKLQSFVLEKNKTSPLSLEEENSRPSVFEEENYSNSIPEENNRCSIFRKENGYSSVPEKISPSSATVENTSLYSVGTDSVLSNSEPTAKNKDLLLSILHVLLTEDPKSHDSNTSLIDCHFSEEINGSEIMHQEDNISDEIDSGSPKKKIQSLVPQLNNNQLLICEETKNQSVVTEKNNSQVLSPEEENNQISVIGKETNTKTASKINDNNYTALDVLTEDQKSHKSDNSASPINCHLSEEMDKCEGMLQEENISDEIDSNNPILIQHFMSVSEKGSPCFSHQCSIFAYKQSDTNSPSEKTLISSHTLEDNETQTEKDKTDFNESNKENFETHILKIGNITDFEQLQVKISVSNLVITEATNDSECVPNESEKINSSDIIFSKSSISKQIYRGLQREEEKNLLSSEEVILKQTNEASLRKKARIDISNDDNNECVNDVKTASYIEEPHKRDSSLPMSDNITDEDDVTLVSKVYAPETYTSSIQKVKNFCRKKNSSIGSKRLKSHNCDLKDNFDSDYIDWENVSTETSPDPCSLTNDVPSTSFASECSKEASAHNISPEQHPHKINKRKRDSSPITPVQQIISKVSSGGNSEKAKGHYTIVNLESGFQHLATMKKLALDTNIYTCDKCLFPTTILDTLTEHKMYCPFPLDNPSFYNTGKNEDTRYEDEQENKQRIRVEGETTNTSLKNTRLNKKKEDKKQLLKKKIKEKQRRKHQINMKKQQRRESLKRNINEKQRRKQQAFKLRGKIGKKQRTKLEIIKNLPQLRLKKMSVEELHQYLSVKNCEVRIEKLNDISTSKTKSKRSVRYEYDFKWKICATKRIINNKRKITSVIESDSSGNNDDDYEVPSQNIERVCSDIGKWKGNADRKKKLKTSNSIEEEYSHVDQLNRKFGVTVEEVDHVKKLKISNRIEKEYSYVDQLNRKFDVTVKGVDQVPKLFKSISVRNRISIHGPFFLNDWYFNNISRSRNNLKAFSKVSLLAKATGSPIVYVYEMFIYYKLIKRNFPKKEQDSGDSKSYTKNSISGQHSELKFSYGFHCKKEEKPDMIEEKPALPVLKEEVTESCSKYEMLVKEENIDYKDRQSLMTFPDPSNKIYSDGKLSQEIKSENDSECASMNTNSSTVESLILNMKQISSDPGQEIYSDGKLSQTEVIKNESDSNCASMNTNSPAVESLILNMKQISSDPGQEIYSDGKLSQTEVIKNESDSKCASMNTNSTTAESLILNMKQISSDPGQEIYSDGKLSQTEVIKNESDSKCASMNTNSPTAESLILNMKQISSDPGQEIYSDGKLSQTEVIKNESDSKCASMNTNSTTAESLILNMKQISSDPGQEIYSDGKLSQTEVITNSTTAESLTLNTKQSLPVSTHKYDTMPPKLISHTAKIVIDKYRKNSFERKDLQAEHLPMKKSVTAVLKKLINKVCKKNREEEIKSDKYLSQNTKQDSSDIKSDITNSLFEQHSELEISHNFQSKKKEKSDMVQKKTSIAVLKEEVIQNRGSEREKFIKKGNIDYKDRPLLMIFPDPGQEIYLDGKLSQVIKNESDSKCASTNSTTAESLTLSTKQSVSVITHEYNTMPPTPITRIAKSVMNKDRKTSFKRKVQQEKIKRFMILSARKKNVTAVLKDIIHEVCINNREEAVKSFDKFLSQNTKQDSSDIKSDITNSIFEQHSELKVCRDFQSEKEEKSDVVLEQTSVAIVKGEDIKSSSNREKFIEKENIDYKDQQLLMTEEIYLCSKLSQLQMIETENGSKCASTNKNSTTGESLTLNMKQSQSVSTQKCDRMPPTSLSRVAKAVINKYRKISFKRKVQRVKRKRFTTSLRKRNVAVVLKEMINKIFIKTCKSCSSLFCSNKSYCVKCESDNKHRKISLKKRVQHVKRKRFTTSLRKRNVAVDLKEMVNKVFIKTCESCTTLFCSDKSSDVKCASCLNLGNEVSKSLASNKKKSNSEKTKCLKVNKGKSNSPVVSKYLSWKKKQCLRYLAKRHKNTFLKCNKDCKSFVTPEITSSINLSNTYFQNKSNNTIVSKFLSWKKKQYLRYLSKHPKVAFLKCNKDCESFVTPKDTGSLNLSDTYFQNEITHPNINRNVNKRLRSDSDFEQELAGNTSAKRKRLNSDNSLSDYCETSDKPDVTNFFEGNSINSLVNDDKHLYSSETEQSPVPINNLQTEEELNNTILMEQQINNYNLTEQQLNSNNQSDQQSHGAKQWEEVFVNIPSQSIIQSAENVIEAVSILATVDLQENPKYVLIDKIKKAQKKVDSLTSKSPPEVIRKRHKDLLVLNIAQTYLNMYGSFEKASEHLMKKSNHVQVKKGLHEEQTDESSCMFSQAPNLNATFSDRLSDVSGNVEISPIIHQRHDFFSSETGRDVSHVENFESQIASREKVNAGLTPNSVFPHGGIVPHNNSKQTAVLDPAVATSVNIRKAHLSNEFRETLSNEHEPHRLVEQANILRNVEIPSVVGYMHHFPSMINAQKSTHSVNELESMLATMDNVNVNRLQCSAFPCGGTIHHYGSEETASSNTANTGLILGLGHDSIESSPRSLKSHSSVRPESATSRSYEFSLHNLLIQNKKQQVMTSTHQSYSGIQDVPSNIQMQMIPNFEIGQVLTRQQMHIPNGSVLCSKQAVPSINSNHHSPRPTDAAALLTNVPNQYFYKLNTFATNPLPVHASHISSHDY